MRTTLIVLLLTLAGCTFVRLSDAGANVAQLNPADAINCQELGLITSNTKAKVVVNRSRDAVSEELIVLARNEAATMGANAIVPVGDVENGTQRFRAYRCN